MREIKFRAWDKKENKWLEQEYYHLIDLVGNIRVYSLGKLYDTDNIIELQQFTGLKDKNGKDIYEGDIVRINNLTETWKNGEPNFDWRIFKIEYNQYTWAFNNSVLYMPMSTYKDRAGEFYDYDIEVIGNIYENPELLTN